MKISCLLCVKNARTSQQTIFPSSSEVLLCHLAHFHSAGSWGRVFFSFLNVSGKECVSVDKHCVKMGLCDKTGFPISWSWMGEP